jgi:hypothetical protein
MNKLTLQTGRLASGQGQLQYSEFIPVAVATPPNWKTCEGKYGTASGDLGPVLPEREAPRERGAGLNLTTYKVYKVYREATLPLLTIT